MSNILHKQTLNISAVFDVILLTGQRIRANIVRFLMKISWNIIKCIFHRSFSYHPARKQNHCRHVGSSWQKWKKNHFSNQGKIHQNSWSANDFFLFCSFYWKNGDNSVGHEAWDQDLPCFLWLMCMSAPGGLTGAMLIVALVNMILETSQTLNLVHRWSYGSPYGHRNVILTRNALPAVLMYI